MTRILCEVSMCRLFGLLGEPHQPPDHSLARSDRSLLSLANVREDVRQGEGWGIAWYGPDRRPVVVKGIGCAADPGEREAYMAASARARTPLVLGHLRKASNPKKLPRERLLGLANSQPFVHGSTLFAHNGSIPLPDATRSLCGRYESEIRGVNDSEVLFYLVLNHLDMTSDPARAFADTVADLTRIWNQEGRPGKFAYSGLNVLLALGPHELWAFCLSAGEPKRGLRDKTVPYYQMTYAGDTTHLLVASEVLDTTRTDWKPLTNGSYLVAQDEHGTVRFRTGAIPLAPGLRAAPALAAV